MKNLPSGHTARRLDLDRLRIAACLLLFPFHTGQVFDQHQAYHIKSTTQLLSLEYLDRTINAWHMPLFFLLAGMSAIFAIKRNTGPSFVWDRFRRLLPTLLVALLTIAPAIKYLERLGGRDMTIDGVELVTWQPQPPLEFYISFMTDIDVFTWTHLWFLAYLLALTALTTPLLLALRRAPDACPLPVERLVWLPVIILVAIELALRPLCGDLHNLITDWANIAVYTTVFITGAAMARWPTLEAEATHQFRAFVGLAVAGVIIMLWAWQGPLANVGRAMADWGTLAAMLGSRRWLSRPAGAVQAYLAQAQLPVYVLHHLPLVALAFLLRDAPLPLVIRFGAIMGGAVVITFTVYHLLIRPLQTQRTVALPETIPASAG
jgi:glucans biosynthesis protein C